MTFILKRHSNRSNLVLFCCLVPRREVYGAISKSTVKGGLVGIQNDQNGRPAWIVHGFYRMDKMNSTSPMFNATFYMMKLNGSATHTHTISKINWSVTTTTKLMLQPLAWVKDLDSLILSTRS